MKIQEARDWINSLHSSVNSKDNLYHYTGGGELPDGYVSLMWMDRDGKIFVNEDGKDADGLFFEMPYCTHGDYVGSTVEMANFNVLTSKEFLEDNNLPPHTEGHGRFGSTCLFYDLSRAKKKQLKHLKEIVEALDGYPVVDEDAWTNLEQEIIDNDIYDNLAWMVEREISNMDRDDVVAWYNEGVEENTADVLFDIIHYESAGYVETYVEGISSVVYGESEKWFAERIIERFDSQKEA